MKIVKIGGSVLFKHHQPVAQALVNWSGKLLVIIGYGPRLRLLSRVHGLPERRLLNMAGSCVRLTDEVTAAASYFAASIEMRHLSSALQLLGVQCSSLCGSQGILCGDRHARVRYWDAGVLKTHDGDCSGHITRIANEVIEKALGATQCLVLAPLMRDISSGRLLVCDADHAAVTVANALTARSLTMITDVPGFVLDKKVVPRVPEQELDHAIATATGGMRKKLACIQQGLRKGLETVVVGGISLLTTRIDPDLGTTFECAPRTGVGREC